VSGTHRVEQQLGDLSGLLNQGEVARAGNRDEARIRALLKSLSLGLRKADVVVLTERGPARSPGAVVGGRF